MQTFFKKNAKYFLLLIPAFCVFTVFVGMLPPVRVRLDNWVAEIQYSINPPEDAVFIPQQQQEQIDFAVTATLRALILTATPTPLPTTTSTPTLLPDFEGPTPTLFPTNPPTATPIPPPESAQLEGFVYHNQRNVWNYCGPATLATTLSYWGWEGDRYTTGAYLRGGLDRDDDKNTMPYEMQNYVQDETGLRMLVRVGGNLDLLKRLLAGGFPVIVEKDDELEGVGWLGHYLLLSGYDDSTEQFVSLDAYHGEGTRYGYEKLYQSWRAFNFTFLVTYDIALETALFDILGPYVDENWSNQHALEIAQTETSLLSGLDLFYAWFNTGTSHVGLLQYADAAFAYDFAFSLYSDLDADLRPWRMVWYQTGPYWAYYYTGRYQDVISLADTTLNAMRSPILEESFYWRALGKEAVGDIDGAIADLNESVRLNPNFLPGWGQLARIQGG